MVVKARIARNWIIMHLHSRCVRVASSFGGECVCVSERVVLGAVRRESVWHFARLCVDESG